LSIVFPLSLRKWLTLNISKTWFVGCLSIYYSLIGLCAVPWRSCFKKHICHFQSCKCSSNAEWPTTRIPEFVCGHLDHHSMDYSCQCRLVFHLLHFLFWLELKITFLFLLLVIMVSISMSSTCPSMNFCDKQRCLEFCIYGSLFM
jgi:hypothetical protein